MVDSAGAFAVRSSILSALAAGACAIFAPAGSALGERTLTVDSILKLEGFNRVVFSPDGRSLFYERIGPYESAPNTASFYGGNDLSILSQIEWQDLTANAPSTPLFDQERDGGYWMGGFSPNGRRLAVFALVRGKTQAGVVDLAKRKTTWFDFTASYSEDVHRPVWASDHELIYAALQESDFATTSGRTGYASVIADHWRRTFAGSEPSVNVMLSTSDGLSSARAFRSGRLMWVDSVTGRSTEIAQGYFHGLRLSADRRYLGVLREAGPVQPGPDERVDLYGYGPDPNRHQLVVVNVRDKTVQAPCPNCDVLLGSLNWSLDGKRLRFMAKGADETIQRAQLYEYQPEMDLLVRMDTLGVHLGCGAVFAPGMIHVGTLSGAPVVYGHRRADDRRSAPTGVLDCRSLTRVEDRVLDTRRAVRNDWFLLTPNGAINLTSDLSNVDGALLGQSEQAVFVLADGDVWRIPATGSKRNLTTDATSPLERLTGYEILGSVFQEEDLWNGYQPPTDRAVLLSASEMVSIDLQTSRTTIIRTPDPRRRIRAISSTGDLVLTEKTAAAAELKLILEGSGHKRRVLRTLNEHNQAVAARQVSVSFTGPGGGELMSCLMLPPTWSRDRAYPAVVVTYPDTDGSCWSDGSLNPMTLGMLHVELLAANGYVVLHTAEPAAEVRGENGRTERLTQVVMAAVTAAVREGYVDPERLGLIGVSQGMHGALQLATETDRFKAIVVGFGVSNAAGYYNSIAPRCRLGYCAPGAASRYEHELSPNYIGAKPWEAPMLYTANSPVFHAHRITAPVLLFGSDFDVFPNQSEEMFSALYRLRKDAQFAFYWGEEHGVFSPGNMRDYWGRVLGWYERYLTASRLDAGSFQ